MEWVISFLQQESKWLQLGAASATTLGSLISAWKAIAKAFSIFDVGSINKDNSVVYLDKLLETIRVRCQTLRTDTNRLFMQSGIYAAIGAALIIVVRVGGGESSPLDELLVFLSVFSISISLVVMICCLSSYRRLKSASAERDFIQRVVIAHTLARENTEASIRLAESIMASN